MKANKVAKALSKFTDDINEHKPLAMDEYTKDMTIEERKEFYELAGFLKMAKRTFKKGDI